MLTYTGDLMEHSNRKFRSLTWRLAWALDDARQELISLMAIEDTWGSDIGAPDADYVHNLLDLVDAAHAEWVRSAPWHIDDDDSGDRLE